MPRIIGPNIDHDGFMATILDFIADRDEYSVASADPQYTVIVTITSFTSSK